ncbi:hypothetical protein [Bradyrhizobium sp. Tv2a-2]|uniref:hypothetical protein n=1 Tax=Bradyrhizobium sp. Tv2a-2 TaxID=113395 RepID=UPI00055C1AC7|nr:hypothetical protein [Bradyrhizobium sp. Tv2a-2]
MADIAQTLAADVLEASGLSCLYAEPGAGSVRITIGGIAARKKPGTRLWLRSQKQAERVLAELMASHREARKNARGGLFVAAEPEMVEKMLRVCAGRLGYAISPDEHLDVTLSSLQKRIGKAIDALQSTGQMKKLNREYAALRKGTLLGDIKGTSGTSLPSYSEWLVDRLKKQLPAYTNLANFTIL